MTALLVFPATATAASANATAKQKRTRALVVKQAHSPVFKALKRRLGKLKLDRTPPRGGKRGGHDLLVLDGDALSAREMARRKELKRFSNGGRWVLALDVGSKHHRRALSKHTSFTSTAGGKHRSRSFLFRHAVVNGVPTVLTLDSERLAPLGSGDEPRKRVRKSKRAEANRIADMIGERVLAEEEELPQFTSAGAAGAPAADESSIPPEALLVSYSDTVTGSQQPKDGHVSSGPSVPTPGYQVSEWTMNHNFTVYLDNSAAHPQGDFQMVTYDLAGSFTPARQGTSFFHMFDRGGGDVERAWFTGLVDPSVAPTESATDGKLTWQANEPKTENQETETSSAEGFDVGIAVSKGGPALDASYHASHGKSFEIPDWGVMSRTSGNGIDWELSARHPCDLRAGASPPPEQSCFGISGGVEKFPSVPNGLSLGQMTVNTSARWRTKQLLSGDAGKLGFDVQTPVTLFDAYCPDAVKIIGCPNHSVDRFVTGPAKRTYMINAADAIPVPVKSIDLVPKEANGAVNEEVKGTLELERPAPFDTTVDIFAQGENAIVGPPIANRVTKKSITVSKGETSASFRVQTNDNDINEGDHVTAYISAFYGGPSKPYPLTIISKE